MRKLITIAVLALTSVSLHANTEGTTQLNNEQFKQLINLHRSNSQIDIKIAQVLQDPSIFLESTCAQCHNGGSNKK